MRIFVTKLRFRFAIAAFGGAVVSALGVFAWGADPAVQATVPPMNPDAILFLHLRWKTNAVTLIKATVVAGSLKPPVEGADGLVVQLQAEDGEVLHEGRIARPNVRLYEVGDPATPGNITARVVTVPETEFTIRLPRMVRARQVEFFEPAAPSGRAGASRSSLGRIALPL